MKYQVQMGYEDSPVLWSANFKTKEEARAYKRGFIKARDEFKGPLYDVAWCVVREKK